MATPAALARTLRPQPDAIIPAASEHKPDSFVIDMEWLDPLALSSIELGGAPRELDRRADPVLVPQPRNDASVFNVEGADAARADTSADTRSTCHDDLVRHASNACKVLLHHLAAVGAPTVVREIVQSVIEPALTGLAATVVGGASLLTPVALEIAGLIRDTHTGVGNRMTLISRVLKLLLVGSAGITLSVTGIRRAAPALAAMTIYTGLRDTIQNFVQLGDNNTRLSSPATGIAAVAYAGNQAVVDRAMTALVGLLEPLIGPIWAGATGRALVNIGGEFLADLTQRGITSALTQEPGNVRPLEITLTLSRDGDATNRLLNTAAGRESLLVAAVAFAVACGGGLAGGLAAAATLGVGYWPFIFCHAQNCPDHVERAESAKNIV